MRFLILFIFLASNAFANNELDIKNVVIHKNLKKYDNLTFLDQKNNELRLESFKGNLVILNFWATWCAPCMEEMPSLDKLQNNKNLNNLKVFPINIGKEDIQKSQKFFDDLNIQNLEFYLDNPITLAKKLALRGIPTSVLFNKENKEFARIIGSIDFENKEFVEWLINFN